LADEESMKKLILLLLCLPLQAFGFVELNAFYFSKSETTATSSTAGYTFLEATLGFRVDRQGQYLVGWGYASHSESLSGSSTTAYSSSQMGPRFLWMIDKQKTWSLGFAYYIVTSASYSSGSGSADTWKGTALHVDGGYNMPVGDSFYASLRLNYSAATYSELLTGGTSYSTISYAKTYIYPSVAAVYIW
jgi:hypothetical protein